MDILIGYAFITTGLFTLTWGLLKIVEKIAQIEFHIDRINKQLDEYDQSKRATEETK